MSLGPAQTVGIALRSPGARITALLRRTAEPDGVLHYSFFIATAILPA